MVKFICDCCGKKDLKEKDVKQVCEDCFKERFEKVTSMEEQVERKMDDETTGLLKETKKENPKIKEENYLDWTKGININ